MAKTKKEITEEVEQPKVLENTEEVEQISEVENTEEVNQTNEVENTENVEEVVKYKALRTFAGLISMGKDEVKDLSNVDKFIIEDLLSSNYIEKI